MSRTLYLFITFMLICAAVLVCNAETESRTQQTHFEHLIQSVNQFQSQTLPHQHAPLLRVAVEGHGTIQGHVYTPTDNWELEGIVEAIQLSAEGDTLGHRTAVPVNPDGFYEIPALPQGDYYVMVWADGYEVQYYQGAASLADATPVPVNADEITSDINFKLQPQTEGNSVVIGQITNAADGHPLAYASVNVVSRQGWFFYSGLSDTEGHYSIPNIKAGAYYVSASSPGYLPAFYNNKASWVEADTLTIAGNDTLKNINLGLSRGGIISGAITDDEGYALGDVYLEAFTMYEDSVWIDDPNWGDEDDPYLYLMPVGKGISDHNGNYEIAGLENGEYFVRANYYDRWIYAELWYNGVKSWKDASVIPVVQGETVSGIDFQMDLQLPNGSISGIVLDANNEPIIGATVHIQSHSEDEFKSSRVWTSVQTDKQGRYRVTHLPEGEYYISAYANSKWQYVYRWWPNAESMQEAETIFVAQDSLVKNIDFQLPLVVGAASISGFVTSTDGDPIKWANVTLQTKTALTDPEERGIWAYASTDSNGYYEINQLPAGEYIASASAWQEDRYGESWFDRADSLEAANSILLSDRDERDDIHFILDMQPVYGTLSGVVIDPATNEPIERAYIEIQPQHDWYTMMGAPYLDGTRCFWYWPYYVVTGTDGSFVLENLWKGEYILSAYTHSGFQFYKQGIVIEQAEPIHIIGGETTDISINVPAQHNGKGGITGMILDEHSGEPFEIAVVKARPATTILVWPDSEKFYSTVSETDGSYTLNGLPDGEYYISAFSPYAMETYYPNVYDPSESELIRIENGDIVEKIDINLNMMLFRYPGGPEDDYDNRNNSGTRIYGTVTDADGHNLASCTIYVYQNSETPMLSVSTQKDGSYEIVGIPVGEYYLQATRIGFNGQFNGNVSDISLTEPVQVPMGNTRIDFVLPLNIPTTVQEETAAPTSINLIGNYPNPFNPETSIQFELPKTEHVKLQIFNINGLLVSTLVDNRYQAGSHIVMWNATSSIGLPVASGVYIARLSVGSYVQSMKMALMR